mmetsp:Transcript_66557/g.159077  ORF Transcript_66557/g.159077 Transcript_66557/m.159077 type:complete len:302 (+) Transcript_66557:431-1336(+)
MPTGAATEGESGMMVMRGMKEGRDPEVVTATIGAIAVQRQKVTGKMISAIAANHPEPVAAKRRGEIEALRLEVAVAGKMRDAIEVLRREAAAVEVAAEGSIIVLHIAHLGVRHLGTKALAEEAGVAAQVLEIAAEARVETLADAALGEEEGVAEVLAEAATATEVVAVEIRAAVRTAKGEEEAKEAREETEEGEEEEEAAIEEMTKIALVLDSSEIEAQTSAPRSKANRAGTAATVIATLTLTPMIKRVARRRRARTRRKRPRMVPAWWISQMQTRPMPLLIQPNLLQRRNPRMPSLVSRS